MKKNENLGMAINFANGTDIKADLSNITLDRINNGSINRIEIQKLEDMNDMITMDQDIINVGSFNFREVTIKFFLRPHRGEKLHDNFTTTSRLPSRTASRVLAREVFSR